MGALPIWGRFASGSLAEVVPRTMIDTDSPCRVDESVGCISVWIHCSFRISQRSICFEGLIRVGSGGVVWRSGGRPTPAWLTSRADCAKKSQKVSTVRERNGVSTRKLTTERSYERRIRIFLIGVVG